VIVAYEKKSALKSARTRTRMSMRQHELIFERQQREFSDGWYSFSSRLDGSITSSGLSKPAFVHWLANSDYEFAWHIEDDVVYTGNWTRLFAVGAASHVDLVNCYSDIKDNARLPWLEKFPAKTCNTTSSTTCYADSRVNHIITKSRWPVLGMSRRLARAIAAEFEDDHGARGHHETLVGTICRLNDWCTMRSLPSSCMGRFVLRGFHGLSSQMYGRGSSFDLPKLAKDSLAGVVQPNRLYHPIKCISASANSKRALEEPPNDAAFSGSDTDDGTEPCAGDLHYTQYQIEGLLSALESDSGASKQSGDIAAASRMAVCITGQLGRLELASKNEHLVMPNLADVFLVLDDGDFVVSNEHFPNLTSSNMTIDLVKGVFGDMLKQSVISNAVEMESHIKRFVSFRMDLNDTQRRGTNLLHFMRQAAHIAKCADLIESFERSSGTRYQTIVQIRDNTLVMNDFQVPTDGTSFLLPSVHVKSCCGWRGLNDKALVVPRALLHALKVVWNGLRSVSAGEAFVSTSMSLAGNAEQFLSSSFESAGIPYIKQPADILPFVDGKLQMSSSGIPQWCKVRPWKDCHPSRGPNAASIPVCRDLFPIDKKDC